MDCQLSDRGTGFNNLLHMLSVQGCDISTVLQSLPSQGVWLRLHLISILYCLIKHYDNIVKEDL